MSEALRGKSLCSCVDQLNLTNNVITDTILGALCPFALRHVLPRCVPAVHREM